MIAEYQAQEQRSLPFKELGFPTLEAFMRSITDTVYIEYNHHFLFPCVLLFDSVFFLFRRRYNGELTYRCIPTRTDKHIHELVQKQRGPGERRAFQARAQKSASRSSSSFSLTHAKPDITALFQRALLYNPMPPVHFPNTCLPPLNFFPPALPALVRPLIAPPPISLPFTSILPHIYDICVTFITCCATVAAFVCYSCEGNALPAHFMPPFPASQLASFSCAPAVDVRFAPPLAHQSAAAAFASLPPAPFAPTPAPAPAPDAYVSRVNASNGQISQSGAPSPTSLGLGLPAPRVEPDTRAFADRVSLPYPSAAADARALEPLDILEQRRAIPDDVAPRLPARNVLAAAAAQSSAAAFVRKV